MSHALQNPLPEQNLPQTPPSGRLRLDYLDGLRGLAALYVVMHHIYYSVVAEFVLPPRVAKLTYWLILGRSAVDIFIVLSGYCLMLPVVRAGVLKGGTLGFLKRRARRILPPYYFAMGLALIAIAVLPPLHDRSVPNAFWNAALPAFTPGILLSHLLLIHNFNPAWANKIDHPMWSVATEWQIYFFFPLLLLPVWKRWGSAAAVGVAFLISLPPWFFFFNIFREVVPLFLGLFALGMAAADINFSPKPSLQRWRERLPWGGLAAGLTAGLIVISVQPWHWVGGAATKDGIKEIIVGMATACLLVACTRWLTRRHETSTDQSSTPAPIVLRILESRPAIRLGTFSYSLYLIHAPVLALCMSALRPFHLTPTVELAVMLAAATPLALAVSFLFHLAFEKPFLSPALVTAEKKLAQ